MKKEDIAFSFLIDWNKNWPVSQEWLKNAMDTLDKFCSHQNDFIVHEFDNHLVHTINYLLFFDEKANQWAVRVEYLGYRIYNCFTVLEDSEIGPIIYFDILNRQKGTRIAGNCGALWLRGKTIAELNAFYVCGGYSNWIKFNKFLDKSE